MRFRSKAILSAAAACCLSALCSAVGAADNPSRGVALKGQAGAFGSWVKSKGFPVGRQHVAAYGAGVGYYAARMSYFAFFNRHQAIHSVPRGLLLYRRYEGYACGASVRRALGEVKYLGAPFGVGDLNRDGVTTASEAYSYIFAACQKYWNTPSRDAEWNFLPAITGGAEDVILFERPTLISADILNPL